MELYKLTVAKLIQGKWHDDWYSGQLGHMAKYGDKGEARAHLCGPGERQANELKPQVVRPDGTICEVRSEL